MSKLDQFTAQLLDYLKKIPGLAPVLLNLLLGGLLLFFGYKLFRYWLFLLGAQVGYNLALQLTQWLQLTASASLLIIVVFILGMGLLYWSSVRFSFALAGFSMGAMFARHYGGFLTKNPNLLFILLVGVVTAVLAYLFVRHFLIVGTAAYGALIASDSLYALMTQSLSGSFIHSQFKLLNQSVPVVLVALTLVLSTIGIWWQLRSSQGGSKIRVFF